MTNICIVTIASGSDSGIVQTSRTVDDQSLSPCKHVLVTNRVPRHELEDVPRNPWRVVIRDEDTSLFNAMNIGLSHAEGDLILFLNAGDSLFRSFILSKVAHAWDGHSIVCGRSIQTFGNDIYLRPGIGRLDDLRISAPHQAFFAPLAIDLPRYDEEGRIGADSIWMEEVKALVGSIVLLPSIVCQFQLGGLSNSPNFRSVRRRAKFDGVWPATKEVLKLALHRAVGPRMAYRFLYRNKYVLNVRSSNSTHRHPYSIK